MSDRETQPGRSDSDYLRQKAYQQEAEALREDLVAYFETSGAMEDLRAKLGVMIEQVLRQVVNEALQDPDIQTTIRDQVAAAVIDGVRGEIVSRQNAILSSVKGQLLPTWQKEVRAVLEQGLRQPQEREPRRKTPDEAVVTRPVETPGQDTGTLPQEVDDQGVRSPGPEIVKPRPPLPPWVRSAAIGAGVAVLVVVAFLIGLRSQERPAPRTDANPPAPVDSPGPSLEPDSQEQVFIRTMRVADAALPAESRLFDSLREHSYSDQYRCWFDAEARRQLDYLVEHPNIDGETFRSTLRTGYNGCVQREYALEISKLPVFAAQGTVHYLLLDQQKKGWKLCADKKAPEGLPDLKSFLSDGEVGRSTSALLNGFLACTGYSPNLTIGPGSMAEEYLFVVYVALQELGRR